MSKGYDYIRTEMKKRGMLQPKRHDGYQPRVQIVGKTEEHIQNKLILLAYERDISVGELLDLLVRELLGSKNLLRRCLRRRQSPQWCARLKTGHEIVHRSKTVEDYCRKHGLPLDEILRKTAHQTDVHFGEEE